MPENGGRFEILKKAEKELRASLTGNIPLPAEKLRNIREHIRFCDELEKGRFDTFLFFSALDLWKKCYVRWLITRPPEEENIEMSDIYVKTRRSPGEDTRPKVTSLQKVEPPPKKPDEKTVAPQEKPEVNNVQPEMTRNDRRFLRSLRISPDPTDENPDGNPDSK